MAVVSSRNYHVSCLKQIKHSMEQFPKVIASSVIRSAHQGESHGGVYIIDVATGDFNQVIDWNKSSISWEGRGFDRGLRGIAFYNKNVILAASDEVYLYSSQFNLLESYRNQYLKHCHEIFVHDDTLFLTSTGYDSILEFDLVNKKFVKGYSLRPVWAPPKTVKKLFGKLNVPIRPKLKLFDPNGDDGPKPADTIHINNVSYQDEKLFISGTGLNILWFIKENKLFSYAKIPLKTHNASPYGQGVLLNDTASNRIVYMDRDGKILEEFSIHHFDDHSLIHADLPQDHARQAFGRGLCLSGDNYLIGGSSPATISVYQWNNNPKPIKTINITMDIRNSIHGLEIWPY